MSHMIVIGGGPAGMMCAVRAAQRGHQVELFEQNEKLGKKLFITGKGRCNLTNACGEEELGTHVCSNARFLYSAFSRWSNRDTMRFFEDLGLKLKVERGERVFPQSDHSSDVIRTLEKELKRQKVQIHLNTRVSRLLTETVSEEEPAGERTSAGAGGGPGAGAGEGSGAGTGGEPGTGAGEEPGEGAGREAGKRQKSGHGLKKGRIRGVVLEDGTAVMADAVAVCTGGLSYPSTGATGDGYRLARETGHTVTECSPSLVPLETEEPDAAALQGLSLRNVQVTIRNRKKVLYEDFGEMLFTHFGVSGPLILTASTCIQKELAKEKLTLEINLKPALTEKQLDERLQREFLANANRQFKNSLGSLYPAKLVPVIQRRSGIPAEKSVHDITREERKRLVQITRQLTFTITGLRGYTEAIITHGGVSVRQIRPDTMESKTIQGLYFAGEVLDLDAVTGGFNLQIAWSTGYAAGDSV